MMLLNNGFQRAVPALSAGTAAEPGRIADGVSSCFRLDRQRIISWSHAVVGDQRIDRHFRGLLEVNRSVVSRTSLDERGVFHVRLKKSKLLRNKTLD